MEREHIKGNLLHIVAIAERMHIPGSADRILNLARNTLHMLERMDNTAIEHALVVAMLADSTRVRNGAVDFEDISLLDKAALEAHRLFPREAQE